MATRMECCICWESPEDATTWWPFGGGVEKKKFLRLPCRQQHSVCSECIIRQTPAMTSCPLRCFDGAFDRRAALDMLGLVESSSSRPTPSEAMQACSRAYTTRNELKGQVVQAPSPDLQKGLTVESQCENSTCPLRERCQLFSFGQGEHDILLDSDKYNCGSCGDTCEATKLVFKDCAIDLTVCERFQGGRKNLYSVKETACGKVVSYDLSGNYVKLVASTTRPTDSGLGLRPIQPIPTNPQGLTLNLVCSRCGIEDCLPLGIGRHDGSSWTRRSVCKSDRCGEQMIPFRLTFNQVWHASVKIDDGINVKFAEHTDPCHRHASFELDVPDQHCRIVEVHSAASS